jgi:hypothetical protein
VRGFALTPLRTGAAVVGVVSCFVAPLRTLPLRDGWCALAPALQPWWCVPIGRDDDNLNECIFIIVFVFEAFSQRQVFVIRQQEKRTAPALYVCVCATTKFTCEYMQVSDRALFQQSHFTGALRKTAPHTRGVTRADDACKNLKLNTAFYRA